MTTNPFQSILQQSGTTPVPANDDQAQPSWNDMIAGIFRQSSSSGASGANAGQSTASGARQPSGGVPPRLPLKGGTYSEHDAMLLVNQHYCVGRNDNETAVFRKHDNGTLSFVADKQFKLEVQNISVLVGDKLLSVENYWKKSPQRDEKALIFKPGGAAQANEYNLWRGFAIEPSKGWQRQRRFLSHLLQVICRRNKQKFKYLMRLLAWFVQNPDKHAEVVLVLKSREQGTGKSTVGKVMLDIFGKHGFLVDDKDRLLGRFNDWLETACFVLAEEILFAGDRKADDKMKSMVTSPSLQVEGKFRTLREVPNRTKYIATTNHDHAVAAGSRERRKIVYEVGNEHVGDRAYFDALYRDLTDGGTSEFLWLLQNIKLADWHPRMIIKTDETTEQQRMSGDSVSQWCQSCIEADEITLSDESRCHTLGSLVPFPDLLSAYTEFCKQTGQRPVAPETFGSECTKFFGAKKRLTPIPPSNKRPSGYHVPTGSLWQQELDKRLGVK
jgi:Family of unknown function (DUF5906)